MFQEILVTDYIADYSKLTTDQISKIVSKNLKDPNFFQNCPNGTVIGIIISQTSNLQRRVFFPFFSHVITPIKAGERAWAFIPDNGMAPYWLTRKVQSKTADDLNFTKDDSARLYPILSDDPDRRKKVSALFFDARASGAPLSTIRSESISRSEFVGEPVSNLVGSCNDTIIQGSNNTAIKFGNGGEPGTGTVDIVAGVASTTLQSSIKNTDSYSETIKPLLSSDDNSQTIGLLGPDDESRITISRSFNGDAYYSLPGDDSGNQPEICLKSDGIRVFAKKDLKIYVEGDLNSSILIKSDGNIVINPGSKIKLSGENDDQPYLRYDEFNSLIGEITSALSNLSLFVDSVATAAGVTPVAYSDLAAKLAAVEEYLQSIKSQKILGS